MFKIYFKNGGSTKPYKGNVGNILFGLNLIYVIEKKSFVLIHYLNQRGLNGNIFGNFILESG